MLIHQNSLNNLHTVVLTPTENNIEDRNLSNKNYELKDHLGNVRLTFSDWKVKGSTVFELDVKSINNYYPFGYEQEGRGYTSSNSRYGFNGHEKDDEISGNGNHLSWGDYGMDTRLGRRWQIDPQWQRMSGQSPYSVNNNSPIAFADKDGEIAQLMIQYGVNVSINIMTQMITAYMLDPNINSWEEAWDKTSLWQAFGEGAVDMIGTKKLKIAANAVMGMATYVDQVGIDNVDTQGLMTSGMIGLLEPIIGDAIAKHGSKAVASMLSSKMGLASKTIHQLTGVWHSATDGNFVGNLANKLGDVVENIEMNYKFSGGAGDVDIVTKTMNIEVKSGKKMNLTQSLKNAEYAISQGKSYGLYMPNATKAQIYDAQKQGIAVYTTEEALQQAIGN